MRSPAEMKAAGYKAEQNGTSVRVYMNGDHVASLSPLWPKGQGGTAQFSFDWHRHDQWNLRSDEVLALLRDQDAGLR